MKRGAFVPFLVVLFSGAAGGWLLQEGVDRSDNVYVRVRVLQEVIDRVGDSFVDEIDANSLYNSAIDGLLDELDQHSSYVPASAYENLRIRNEGEYGGIGLEVLHRNGYVTVVSPIQGGPGGRLGIRPGDQFFEIDGVAADTMTTDQAVDLLRGRPGTDVTVRMLRPGVDEPIEFTVERAVIQLRAVPFALLVEDGIGYVPFAQVRETSTDEIRNAIDSLQAVGMRALIFDLRNNPGGLLDQGIAVSDLFIDDGGEIVETRGRDSNQNETYEARRPDRYEGMPIVALVDQTSVSAAEIIAGALQDHDRAVLVGETTFGKGSVQSLYRLTGGDVLRLTTAKWYTPVGRSIHLDEENAPELPAEATLAVSGQIVLPLVVDGRPEFVSEGGRTLYGGGGITPDLYVQPETLETDEARAIQGLFRRGSRFWTAVFAFAVRYVQDHPDVEVGFSLANEDFDVFYAVLAEYEADPGREAYDLSRRYVRYHLEGEIAEQVGGEVGRFLQRRSSDRQLGRAIELLTGVDTPADLLRAVALTEPDASP